MLVLTRKVGESIVIDDDITIRVTAIQGNRVKIALEAPQSRRIMRGEIASEQTRASGAAHTDGNWGRTGTDGPRAVSVTPPTHAK